MLAVVIKNDEFVNVAWNGIVYGLDKRLKMDGTRHRTCDGQYGVLFKRMLLQTSSPDMDPSSFKYNACQDTGNMGTTRQATHITQLCSGVSLILKPGLLRLFGTISAV